MRGKCIKFELATFINFEVIDNKSKRLHNICYVFMFLKPKRNIKTYFGSPKSLFAVTK